VLIPTAHQLIPVVIASIVFSRFRLSFLQL
jgi:hypothetical protein